MDSDVPDFVKINKTFKKWFFGLSDWEEHTVKFVLDYGDIENLVANFDAGIEAMIKLVAHKFNEGDHVLYELHDDHKDVPYMLVDITIIDGTQNARIHLGLEKQSLYVVITSMGKLDQDLDVDEYYEICEQDKQGNDIKRFAGKVAKDVKHSYTAARPGRMGFGVLKDTIMKVVNDTMGLRREVNKKVAKLRVEDNKNDVDNYPVMENLYYGVSESARFLHILRAMRRSLLNHNGEVTAFDLALNWKLHSTLLRRLCKEHPHEDGSNVAVKTPASWITNMMTLKDNVKLLTMVNKRKREEKVEPKGKKGRGNWNKKSVGESSSSRRPKMNK